MPLTVETFGANLGGPISKPSLWRRLSARKRSPDYQKNSPVTSYTNYLLVNHPILGPQNRFLLLSRFSYFTFYFVIIFDSSFFQFLSSYSLYDYLDFLHPSSFFLSSAPVPQTFAPALPDLARTVRCAGEVREGRGEISEQNQTGAGFCLLFSKQDLKQHPRSGCDQPSIGFAEPPLNHDRHLTCDTCLPFVRFWPPRRSRLQLMPPSRDGAHKRPGSAMMEHPQTIDHETPADPHSPSLAPAGPLVD
ncbi:MAG: hypothetical protein OEU92_10630 [Alphaproteobacteria bacterium]|nr:hypothetical protein [Alphaproteobacteria bacterium]